MRLNWSLKHTTYNDNRDIKPISSDTYLSEFSRDLFLPYLFQQYIEIVKLPLESDVVLKVKGIQKVLNDKVYMGGEQTLAKRYNLWDGVNVSILMDKKGVPVPRYQINDRNMRIEYLKINQHHNAATIDKFELNITKQRYQHLCPLEYYNYSPDFPELD